MSVKRVVVGMSGGVDSSVAAWLLEQQGYEVIGLFMKNWEDDDTDEYCTSREDLVDAVSVAEIIGIEIEAVNFSTEYRERVFANFLAEYQAGRTPNPDVLCNAEIKFKAFLDHALLLGADHIATGHYAQVRERDGVFDLLKAADASKDQSYFLYRLNQAQLARTLFPLGTMLKRDVRALAQRIGLPNHAKRDSTGICFIGERPFREFLMRYLPTQPGPMETPDGDRVGTHHGLMYYTIGQRQGLGIGGPGQAWYVVDKQIEGNRLVVVQGHDHAALYRDALHAQQLSWVAPWAPAAPQPYAAKTRYRQADAPCVLTQVDSASCEVRFDAPQRAITPGQSVVLYDGAVCLGGGIIS
jgi:tRNA-uridine 2-sulfurtransferase